MSAAAQVTDSTFKQEVLDSEVPVLVDFWVVVVIANMGVVWCYPNNLHPRLTQPALKLTKHSSLTPSSARSVLTVTRASWHSYEPTPT